MSAGGNGLFMEPAANSADAASQPGSSSQHTSPLTRVGGKGLLGELTTMPASVLHTFEGTATTPPSETTRPGSSFIHRSS
jgi:hypothetical protein